MKMSLSFNSQLTDFYIPLIWFIEHFKEFIIEQFSNTVLGAEFEQTRPWDVVCGNFEALVALCL